MSAAPAPITLDTLSPREPLALRRILGAVPGAKIGPAVDWFAAFQEVCAAAGLTDRQFQVVRLTCEGKSPAEITAKLNETAKKPYDQASVEEWLTAGARKLAKSCEGKRLSRSDQAAISRAMQGKAERDPDPDWDPTCHPRGEEKPRVQGMRPFGLVPEDLETREAGPTYDLLTAVCKLTGSRRPPLRLQTREVADLVSVDGGNSWARR